MPYRSRRQQLIAQGLHKRKKKELRRQRAILLLGGQCVHCGLSDHAMLEFDHVDPTSKKYVITRILDYPLEILLQELRKCQLLCPPCHEEKTELDRQKAALEKEEVPF